MKISQTVIINDVIIGFNAVVLGPVILHRGSRVGANAVITKSVPENGIVVSNNLLLQK